MSDNPKSLASLADELPTEKQPTMREHVQEIIERQMPTVEDRCREARARIAEVNKPTKAESFWLRSIPLQGYDADVLLSYIVDEYERLAAAALRAPTIAVTDEMVDAALTEYVGEPPLKILGEEGVGPHRLNMRAALEAALATSNPIDEHIDSVAGASAAYSGPTIAAKKLPQCSCYPTACNDRNCPRHFRCHTCGAAVERGTTACSACFATDEDDT